MSSSGEDEGSRLLPLGTSFSVRFILGLCVPSLPSGPPGNREVSGGPCLFANIGPVSSNVKNICHSHNFPVLLTLLELPECAVSVKENDESDEINEKETNEGAAGGAPPVFAELAVLLWRGDTPASPGCLLSPGRQSLPHSARH